MAQSHIKITGGLLDGKSMRNTISVIGHTFKAGQALRFNRGAATGVCGDFYTAAIADSASNSEVIGVVESVEGNSFVLVYGGEISTANFDPLYALEDDDVFFLSGTTAGLLDKTPPSDAGQVIKPVIVRSEGTKAIVTNFIGTVIGGSSTVNLDGIQPVGTIEPYAGSKDDVPVTWSLCDGGALSITDYLDLYNRIGREFGYHITIQSSAITSSAGIAVGQIVQQNGGLTGRIVSIDFALNQIVVDVDHLKSTGTLDGFTPHNEGFGDTGLSIPNEVSFTEGVIYAGSLTPLASIDQPSSTVTLTSATVTTTAFRKPDLRGKVVMGSASLTPEGNDREGTVIVTDRNSPRGSILGEYEHQLTIAEMPSHNHTHPMRDRALSLDDINSYVDDAPGDGSFGSNNVNRPLSFTGSDEAHNNLQPTVAINWIIKTTSNAKAAIVGNLDADIALTELSDVQITPSDGDIVMYDGSNTPIKFKAYNLLTNYKSNAEQIFQIDTSAANFTSTFPHVRFGGPDSGRNGFSVNLDGLGSGAPKFEVLNSSNSPLMSLQKTTTTDQTYGIASIGTNGPPDEDANLMLGNKGLLFQSSSSTPVNKIVTAVSPTGTATDTNLVTEKAVRDAISDISLTVVESFFLTNNNEIYPTWHTGERTAGTGIKASVSRNYTSPSNSRGPRARLTVSNNTSNDVVLTGRFGIMIGRGEVDYQTVGSISEVVLPANTTTQYDGPVFDTNNTWQFSASPDCMIAVRQATSAESAQGHGNASASFTP